MLVEYDNSDSEPDEKNDDDEENETATKETAETAEISDDDDHVGHGDEDEQQAAGGTDSLAAFAAADDKVEDGLVNRVPASAPQLPPKPSLTAAQQQQLKQEKLKQQQLLLQQKRRRLLILEPSFGDAHGDNEDDEDDEDAAKRRRIASATATCQMRGATSLLARLPKPKALTVREGGSRLFAPSAPQPQPPRPKPLPATEESPSSSSSSSVLFTEPDVHQQHLLDAVLPPKELHRYRQATGASLTADSDGGGIIDIRQADQVAGSDIELTKELTRNAGADPRRRPEGPEPSSMDRRKHQITYLAYQAKERELELKNSWSDARFSQRTSQKKYGF